MKKGFTLIEIIISISLVVLFASFSFLIFNKRNNKGFESTEEEILTAANLYLSAEYDDNGNNFLNGIYKGGRGAILPLSKLVEKGYLSDKTVNSIEKKYNINEHHVLALLGDGTLNNDCSGVTLTISWDEDYSKEIYLCPTSNSSSSSERRITVSVINDSRCVDNGDNIDRVYGEKIITDDVNNMDLPYEWDYDLPDEGFCSNAESWYFEDVFNSSNKYDPGYTLPTRESIMLKVVPTFPSLKEKIDELGISEDSYFPKDSTTNYVLFANKMWNMFYYDGEGVKLVLKSHIGKSAFNEESDVYKSTAFEYYNTDVTIVDFSYSIKVATQEKKGEKISSTIKQKLDNWYNENLKKYDHYIRNTGYCNDTTNRRGGTKDECTYSSAIGGLIKTKIGLLSKYDVINLSSYGEDGFDNFLVATYPYWTMSRCDTLYSPGICVVELSHDEVNDTYISDECSVFNGYDPQSIGAHSASSSTAYVRPVITLDANVDVTDASGTENDPYVIS